MPKISELPSAQPLSSNNNIVVVQNGSTVRSDVGSISTYIVNSVLSSYAPANWNSSYTDTISATSLPTANTLVRRDSSGSAGFTILSAADMRVSGPFIITSPTLGPQFVVNGAGIVTTGSWQGNVISVNFGGTGATTASAARVNLGVPYGRTGPDSILATGSGTINIAASNSIIGSGAGNTISSGSCNVIGGGTNNTTAGTFNIIVGGSGNGVFNTQSIVIGGIGNTSSGSYAIVGSGLGNTASGSFSVICGGSSNISSGTTSFIGNGVSNSATGIQSVIGGGAFNTTSGTNSTVLGGINGVASLFGEDARSSGRFTADGDAQIRRFILRNRTTTTQTTASLFLDGVSSQLVIPPNTTWSYEIRVVGRSVQSINSSSFVFQGMIERSPLTTTLLGATRNTIATDWNPAFNPTLTVSSNGIVTITATQDILQQTGEIYWVAYAEIVQVTVPGTVPAYS